MSLALVLAAIDARSTLRASLGRFRDELAGRGEILLVDASRDGTADEAARLFPDVRILRRPPGRLAPELWADGLRAADAPFVAFSTAQMAPKPGWLSSLLVGIGEDAAVGGPIAPAPVLAPTDRAMYLLRYSNYLPPLPSGIVLDPPGDNALYRRDRLLEVAGSWEAGFWEVEVHRELKRRGERPRMIPDAVVEFLGGNALASAIPRRFSHARHYGAGRSNSLGLAPRLARTAAAPLVPALLSLRIALNLQGRGARLRPWIGAVPGLAFLSSAWALGEVVGTWSRPPARRAAVELVESPVSR